MRPWRKCRRCGFNDGNGSWTTRSPSEVLVGPGYLLPFHLSPTWAASAAFCQWEQLPLDQLNSVTYPTFHYYEYYTYVGCREEENIA